MSKKELRPSDMFTASRVIQNRATIILDMYHEGRITAEEAGFLYEKAYDSATVAAEVDLDNKTGGVLPLDAETNRLMLLLIRMAPTEEPK